MGIGEIFRFLARYSTQGSIHSVIVIYWLKHYYMTFGVYSEVSKSLSSLTFVILKLQLHVWFFHYLIRLYEWLWMEYICQLILFSCRTVCIIYNCKCVFLYFSFEGMDVKLVCSFQWILWHDLYYEWIQQT